MKTNKALIALLTSIALFSITAAANAQYKATGTDGVTASPKLREMINSRAGLAAVPAAPAEAMSCSSCKDEYTTRTDATARGAFKPTVRVVTHLCAGCETTVKTIGVGKASTSVATHKCNTGPANDANCCALNKT